MSACLRIATAATAKQPLSEISSPSDPDLSSPFSIATTVFGFPTYTILGIDSFSFEITQLANHTGTAITTQVYFASGVPISPSNSVAITGCTITVTAGFSGDFSSPTCEVNSSDQSTMISLGILNTSSVGQNIWLGLGPEARNLTFGSSGTVYLTLNGPDPSITWSPNSLTFTVSAGAPAPPPQVSFIYPTPYSAISASPSTTLGGSWMSASFPYSGAPEALSVTVNPTGLKPAVYTGNVNISTVGGLTATIPVSLIVLPGSPQYIQQGPKFFASPSNGIGGKLQGTSVSLSPDGSSALIGAPMDTGGTRNGGAWTYGWTGNAWALPAYDSTALSYSSVGQAFEGYAVSGYSGVFLLGGPEDNSDLGAAWAYNSSCGTAKLVGTGAVRNNTSPVGVQQGHSVSLAANGDTALVGGPLNNNLAGAAWVFTCSEGAWTQQSELVGTGEIGGADQGISVALSGDGNTALVGGLLDNSVPFVGPTGAAWVFAQSAGVWTQQAKLVGNGAIGAAAQGASVALSADGNTAIVGGAGDSNGLGAAWVFTRSGTTWSQQAKLVGAGGVASAQGNMVALSADGNTAAIGGPDDNNSVGAAWVFKRSAGVWNQVGGKFSGSDAVGAAQAGPVALSSDGNTVLLGGPFDNSLIGATWAFVLSGPPPTLTSINPVQITAGSPAFTLTVDGTNFLNGATVVWNGSTLFSGYATSVPTVFESSSQLTATISSGLIASTGTVPIYVVNPDGTPTASATLTVGPLQLSITKMHAGSFFQGQNNAVYTIILSNAAGASATTGPLLVQDTPPPGMTLVSMAGNGWNCTTYSYGCTRNDSLDPGISFPPITVTVNVASDAGPSVTNLAELVVGNVSVAQTYDATTIYPFSLCDINQDGNITVADVQLLIDEALGGATAANDPNHDGAVGVVDIQIVIDAVLNLGCPVV